MKYLSTILSFILLLLFIACSSSVNKNNKVEVLKNVDNSSHSWFMRPDEIAMDHYDKLIDSGMTYEEALVMLRKYEPNSFKYSEEELRQLQAEIDQSISFFCFEYKNYKFESEKKCKSFGQDIYKRCHIYSYGYLNRSVLGCVKRLLLQR